MFHVVLLHLSIIHLRLSDFFNVFQTFLILDRVEDLIKLVLDLASLVQRPVAVLLVTEDDIVEDRPRHSQTIEHFLVDVRTLGTELSCSSLGFTGDGAVQGLDRDVLQFL